MKTLAVAIAHSAQHRQQERDDHAHEVCTPSCYSTIPVGTASADRPRSQIRTCRSRKVHCKPARGAELAPVVGPLPPPKTRAAAAGDRGDDALLSTAMRESGTYGFVRGCRVTRIFT
jgi:hypothetical protein